MRSNGIDWVLVRRLLSPHSEVYLMWSVGRVKIGRTRGCVFRRRDQVARHHEAPIFVMARLRARAELETYLHRYFEYDHVEGEWFKHSSCFDDLARRFNAIDLETFGPRPPHPRDIEMTPWT